MKRLPRSFLPFLWHFVKKQPFSFAIFFTAPLVQILEVTLVPYSLKMIIYAIEHNNNVRDNIFSIITPALWLFGLSWTMLVAISRSQNWWQSYVIPKFQEDIRLTVMSYLSRHSYKYFADNLSGNLANKVADLARASDAVRMKICWNIISTAGVICAALILIMQISSVFAFILIIWVLCEILIGLHFAPKINVTAKQNADDVSKLTGTIVDILNNIISVKLFANRYFELSNLKQVQEREKDSNKRQIAALNRYRLAMDTAALIMLGFLVYFLVSKWQNYEIDTADFVFIFSIYTGIMGTMWYFNEGLPDLFKDIGIINQALSLINTPHEINDSPDATDLNVTAGEIVFKDVTFGYKDENRPLRKLATDEEFAGDAERKTAAYSDVREDFSTARAYKLPSAVEFPKGSNVFTQKNVVIPGGQKLGLVGFSGSGKTTFINLILRFFELQEGQILIDGQNIVNVKQDSLRNNISVIPQDTTLFHRSILDNIRYSQPDALDSEVVKASKDAYCHEFIEKLPEGYNTLVGERGIKLSGGQRQRIAIARSMLKDAPILILDEATSALDSVTEKCIQDSMQNLMLNKTTIVIAHRLSTLAKMDRILVFDKGKIIEDGTHHELINKKGHYQRMWSMQAGGFLPEAEDN